MLDLFWALRRISGVEEGRLRGPGGVCEWVGCDHADQLLATKRARGVAIAEGNVERVERRGSTAAVSRVAKWIPARGRDDVRLEKVRAATHSPTCAIGLGVARR
ncbi:hypothetical protein [Sphingomonas turrisvirgatae]|uniref:Uncharacterized protein n=1 Tax=Sphingomonas turrisvirgatae TaxID=1888892 RepID=A0A1E3M220_9SPHN|nr:hypothetical protein [Sphingomonas turrisvirgatae]ODP39110.1 hypothetical protein BFL28_12185 [Sphingomonas turrisvirgatae]